VLLENVLLLSLLRVLAATTGVLFIFVLLPLSSIIAAAATLDEPTTFLLSAVTVVFISGAD
jgi:hypothetical protein